METDNGKKKRVADAEYALKKIHPTKWPKRKSDIYITRKTQFAAQMEKCKKLIDAGQDKIVLHGLGAAVPRAIHLALQLKKQYNGSLELQVTTSSVKLVDVLVPETDEFQSRYEERKNSAIHICVFRPVVPV